MADNRFLPGGLGVDYKEVQQIQIDNAPKREFNLLEQEGIPEDRSLFEDIKQGAKSGWSVDRAMNSWFALGEDSEETIANDDIVDSMLLEGDFPDHVVNFYNRSANAKAELAEYASVNMGREDIKSKADLEEVRAERNREKLLLAEELKASGGFGVELGSFLGESSSAIASWENLPLNTIGFVSGASYVGIAKTLIKMTVAEGANSFAKQAAVTTPLRQQMGEDYRLWDEGIKAAGLETAGAVLPQSVFFGAGRVVGKMFGKTAKQLDEVMPGTDVSAQLKQRAMELEGAPKDMSFEDIAKGTKDATDSITKGDGVAKERADVSEGEVKFIDTEEKYLQAKDANDKAGAPKNWDEYNQADGQNKQALEVQDCITKGTASMKPKAEGTQVPSDKGEGGDAPAPNVTQDEIMQWREAEGSKIREGENPSESISTSGGNTDVISEPGPTLQQKEKSLHDLLKASGDFYSMSADMRRSSFV